MPLELVEVTAPGHGGLVARYKLTHATPGREGTTLDEPLTLFVDQKSCRCELHIADCVGANPDETLSRLVVWLRRLADGLETRGTSTSIPL